MSPGNQQPPHPSLPSPWAPAPPAQAWTQDPTPPLIWSVAGHDSGGGAGLSADSRAAAALGVHLCPVLAALTAQNSLGVQALFPLPATQIQAQLQALQHDLPPRVIKTGLLGSAAAIDALQPWLGQTPLVVDPVLGASAGGAALADASLLDAYRQRLLPHCSLLTPNRREAERLLGVAPGQLSVPELARRLRALGPQAVCITGGDDHDTPGGAQLSMDWLDSPLASGWIALPRLQPAPGQPLHHHGSGCSFATAAAAALARGFALPDAVILAKMLGWQGLRQGHAAGQGSGPLRPSPDFVQTPQALPVMGWADEPRPDAATLERWAQVLQGELAHPNAESFRPGLYAITEQSSQVAALQASGLFAHIQLRIKTDPGQDPAALAAALRQGLAACPDLWINDHWAQALQQGARALHLGQEDWAALSPAQRQDLLRRRARTGLRLGLSSHSLWELARARGLAPSYIACGPVWPTTTKAMPWQAQGLDNLAWWARMAGRPVVAIGGVLQPEQVTQARQAGAAAVCLVRALATSSQAEPWRIFWDAAAPA
jgi:hydroxymethylpyrimidine kinase/phosphomethylpyrimidine kinase/thiamine-phosphate diphosphorylase